MQRKFILILGVVLVIVGVAGFFLKDKIIPAKAGLQIKTTPQATVFIDGEQVGTTPYEVTRSVGEIILRLVPLTDGTSLAPWGTRIKLTSGVKTVVRRDFADTDSKSAGDVLSFEKIAGKSAEIAVISLPESAQVVLDGEVRGFSSIKLGNLSVGEHKILITKQGFLPREIQARAESGYKLTADVMLAQDQNEAEASSSAEATPSAILGVSSSQTSQVQILDTPTGFLRVRLEPTTSATEAAQVKPGDKYPYLDQNKDANWFKIEYAKGKQGWISSQYAKKIEGK